MILTESHLQTRGCLQREYALPPMPATPSRAGESCPAACLRTLAVTELPYWCFVLDRRWGRTDQSSHVRVDDSVVLRRSHHRIHCSRSCMLAYSGSWFDWKQDIPPRLLRLTEGEWPKDLLMVRWQGRRPRVPSLLLLVSRVLQQLTTAPVSRLREISTEHTRAEI